MGKEEYSNKAFPSGEGGRALSEVGRGKYRFAKLLLYVQSSSALFRPPFGGTFPKGEGIASLKNNIVSYQVCFRQIRRKPLHAFMQKLKLYNSLVEPHSSAIAFS